MIVKLHLKALLASINKYSYASSPIHKKTFGADAAFSKYTLADRAVSPGMIAAKGKR